MARVRQELSRFLTTRLESEKEIKKSGDYRAYSGATVEKLVDLSFELVGKEFPDLNIECLIGTKNPISISDGKYTIKESVDRHIYINGKLVCAVECKSYLDKCFLQRADSDFSLMKSGKEFKSVVLALEDNIDDNSKAFFLNRKNVENIFILYTGKRRSNVLLSDTFKERKSNKLLDAWVEYVYGICERMS